MHRPQRQTWRALLAGGLAIAALAAPGAAQAKPKVKVLGWTTQAGSNAPQVKSKETIDQCFDISTGQRTLHVVFTGSKIAKGTKVASASGAVRRRPASRPSRRTPTS